MINETTIQVNKSIYNLQMIGKNRQYSQIFFNIIKIYGIRVLVADQEEFVKKNKLRIILKKTIAFHIVKVGFLDGLNIKFSNIKWYKEEIAKKMPIH